ncbi:hypothetical protein G6F57_004151 [Rhizopus arrhizus]|uniref:Uncharacterized protein n=1 Tax=Rhizopus oryzae TaxID=64495 RepID=A0A9P6XIK7_RHIOR|nr:hypothetical protein G6F23_001507 [Rhizopus arrhizus]KAG0763896.1 hypothetical protein G6F24_005645 [Rhizopus arrhizus]KAG0790465.1 hypothetical protein G6F21_005782 [Rhizopus arrhizus]KAG0795120.1 hypothetical protein G6F22_005188 [Rhizopus arrhizus]KAG0818106.1 hypothetical protein G6F20_001828 [Rhizopus arrhizus]
MSFISLIRSNPALAPLFVFAGGGVTAAFAYSLHVLRTHPEIEIDKKNNPYPWQHIHQDENIKLMHTHPDFYKHHGNDKPSY